MHRDCPIYGGDSDYGWVWQAERLARQTTGRGWNAYYLLRGTVSAKSKTPRSDSGSGKLIYALVHGWLAFQSPTFKTQKMVLTKPDILDAIKAGDIVIEPLHLDDVGTNSVDLHLSKYLMTIDNDGEPLDVAKPANITLFEIPNRDDGGYLLRPDVIYLASTLERTWTKKHLPTLHGKSSIARMGISIHDAGFGDVGFKGHWTLEITVTQPVRVYAGMPIGQLCYQEVKTLPDVDYMELKASSYTTAWEDPKPQPSKLYKKFAF